MGTSTITKKQKSKRTTKTHAEVVRQAQALAKEDGYMMLPMPGHGPDAFVLVHDETGSIFGWEGRDNLDHSWDCIAPTTADAFVKMIMSTRQQPTASTAKTIREAKRIARRNGQLLLGDDTAPAPKFIVVDAESGEIWNWGTTDMDGHLWSPGEVIRFFTDEEKARAGKKR